MSKEISHHHKSGECPVCGILFAHIHYKGDKPKDFVREESVEPSPMKDECNHEWIDATNEVISGIDICLKCKSVRQQEPSLEQIAIKIATEKTAGWEIKLENLIQRVREDERKK